jgi:hypothetical protein
MLEFSLSPATSRIGQFEWPKEIGCLSNTHKIQKKWLDFRTNLLEVGAGGYDLMDKVLDGEDVVFAENTLDDAVVRDRDSLLGNFAVPTFVDKFPDGLQVRLPAMITK